MTASSLAILWFAIKRMWVSAIEGKVGDSQVNKAGNLHLVLAAVNEAGSKPGVRDSGKLLAGQPIS
jgi:hypothetical protein